MILYAPIINPKVPAFIQQNNNIIIKVPFTHNRAVAVEAISGFQLLIQQYNSHDNNAIEIQLTDLPELYEAFGNNSIDFKYEVKNNNSFFQTGLYYKMQIAYIDKSSNIGPYSTISIGRYIGDIQDIIYDVLGQDSMPLFEKGMGKNNIGSQAYVGVYENSTLPSEIVYQYRFSLKNNQDALVEDTDWQILSPNGTMSFMPKNILEPYLNYTLTYEIQTINGLVIGKQYPLIAGILYPSTYQGDIFAYQDNEAKDNGYVKIMLNGTLAEPGHFKLVRHCDDYENNVWDEISDFSLPVSTNLSQYIWKDCSVEHGASYTYAIQQYSQGNPIIFSERILSNSVAVSFEDMFLSDGTHQLRIQFDPKVSNFKEIVMEQKVDTIGGKYPFFSRNGNVRYKEMAISGLISCHMDKDNYFSTKPAIDTNLTDVSFANERKFKLSVMEWLNNGQPKLFRSPAEGNYIIRLMNVSLSPNDTLGRMIHTFSATGYEVMESNDVASLIKNNLLFLPKTAIKDNYIQDKFSQLVKGGKYYTFTLDKTCDAEGTTYRIVRFISMEARNTADSEQTITLYTDKEDITIEIPKESSAKIPLYTNFSEIKRIEIPNDQNISILCEAFVIADLPQFSRIEWLGDLNADGVIDNQDETLLELYLNDYSNIYIDKYVADLNQDGGVNQRDLSRCQNIVGGSIPKTEITDGYVFMTHYWPVNAQRSFKLPQGYYFYSVACYNSNNEITSISQYKKPILPQGIAAPYGVAYIKATIYSDTLNVPPVIHNEEELLYV